MLPVGGIGLARVSGTGRFDITTGTIGKVGEMSRCLVLACERGEGAYA